MTWVIRLVGSTRLRLLALGGLVAVGALATGCTPRIGDKCALSTDCAVSGGRVCDTSQPGGYCTILNCTNGSCPDNAVCVTFQSSVPGCEYNDYESPSRTGRSFCMAHCSDNSDCRQSDGYICKDPTGSPWNAAILDNNQSQSVCIIGAGPLADAAPMADAAVCATFPPDANAMMSSMGADAAADGEGPDAADASGDSTIEPGSDAAADAGPDASDATVGELDATEDAPNDGGSADAPGGG